MTPGGSNSDKWFNGVLMPSTKRGKQGWGEGLGASELRFLNVAREDLDGYPGSNIWPTVR